MSRWLAVEQRRFQREDQRLRKLKQRRDAITSDPNEEESAFVAARATDGDPDRSHAEEAAVTAMEGDNDT